MTSAVWKFELPTVSCVQEIRLPGGSEVLRIDVQRGKPVLWALVEPERPLRSYFVEAVMTGQPRQKDWGYLGTALLEGGDFVLHYFGVLLVSR